MEHRIYGDDQSFQASTKLFDPAANPKLFKGLLAIVIKVRHQHDSRSIG